MPSAKKQLIKDWFDPLAAQRLAEQIAGVHPGFDQRKFIREATRSLENLELNERVAQFSHALAENLPEDKKRAMEIFTRSLPEISAGSSQISDGWLQWPLGKFIADYGLEHFETSMTAMIELTQRFTSEFAVRPFLEHRQQETLDRLLELTRHSSPHVRRWCSEGSRPLLPWGKRLSALAEDPSPVWPILEALKDDPERYVQKSVANHLNDISKNHPDLVVDRCRNWMKQAGPGRKWMIRHALRTLIKNGHPGALELMGYLPVKGLKIRLKLNPEIICLGESTTLQLELHNPEPHSQRLLIDYAIRYVRQKGKTGRKVFKWTTSELQPGESISINKNHAMKQARVRALYPGMHGVEILVNGERVAESSFDLKM